MGQSFDFFQIAFNLLKDKVECLGYSEDYIQLQELGFFGIAKIFMNVSWAIKGMLLIKFSMKNSSGNVLLFYPDKYLTLDFNSFF